MRDHADNIRFAITPLRRLKGLIGLLRFEGVLLLAPCHDIHTFGMRMNIDVAFVDAGGKVLRVERDLPPRRRVKCRGAVAVLERQANAGCQMSGDCCKNVPSWFQVGDTLRLSGANSP